jgi:hypothetical protein
MAALRNRSVNRIHYVTNMHLFLITDECAILEQAVITPVWYRNLRLEIRIRDLSWHQRSVHNICVSSRWRGQAEWCILLMTGLSINCRLYNSLRLVRKSRFCLQQNCNCCLGLHNNLTLSPIDNCSSTYGMNRWPGGNGGDTYNSIGITVWIFSENKFSSCVMDRQTAVRQVPNFYWHCGLDQCLKEI